MNNDLREEEMKKEKGSMEEKLGKKLCWWNSERCPYNSRGGGLKNANLAWCKSCPKIDAEHLMRFAVEILGGRNTSDELFLYERTLEDELPRLVCLAWREEG